MARRPKRQKGQVEDISAVLLSALASSGLSDQAKRLRIFLCWRDAVGPEIAGRTAPEGFRRGVLLLRASSATWQNELTFLKRDIIRKLNEVIGEPLVRDIKVISGNMPRTPSARSKERPRALSPAAAEAARRCAAVIDDTDVRESFERLLRAHLGAQAPRGR